MEYFKLEIMYGIREFYNPEPKYKPFTHCLDYIRQKSNLRSSVKMKEESLRIMPLLGMTNKVKYYRRRMQWSNLEGKVPMLWLQEIGVEPEVLGDCLRQDQLEFDKFLNVNQKIRYVCYSLENYVVNLRALPENITSKEDAIQLICNEVFAKENSCRWTEISFDYLASYVYKRNIGLIDTVYHHPILKIHDNMLIKTTSRFPQRLVWK